MSNMLDPDTLTKRYYTIGEVSKMFGESTSLLRYWETMFNELKPKKDKSGIRRYVKKDILILKDIYHLVKNQGHTLEGAKEGLKKIKNLKKIKEELLSLKKNMIKLKEDLGSS